MFSISDEVLELDSSRVFSVGVIDDEGWRSSTTLNWISHCFDFAYFLRRGRIASSSEFCYLTLVLVAFALCSSRDGGVTSQENSRWSCFNVSH